MITDSVFSGNLATTLLQDARVSISRTRFEGNGVGSDKWGGAWACCGGAVTLVRTDSQLSDTVFSGNSSGGFGGAIYALGSKLRISGSLFQGNNARAGGAVMFWGRAPKTNIWSTGEWEEAPQLEMRRTQFKGDRAALLGGGVLFAGAVAGDAVLFQANESGGAGGAIADWRGAPLAEPYGGVFDDLVSATQENQADSIALARPILVENHASGPGAALATGTASVVIGNGLIARNQSTGAAAAGAVSATKLVLVNTTVADNPGGGIAAGPTAAIRLGNTILLRNSEFNCAPGFSVSDAGNNLQYPHDSCGGAIAARDPGLDSQYAPGLVSAARAAGNKLLCAADPEVEGVDLMGNARLLCDVGAIERPLPQAMASALGLGGGSRGLTRLVRLLVLLCLLLFLLGFLWAVLNRKRRRLRSRETKLKPLGACPNEKLSRASEGPTPCMKPIPD